MLLPQTSLEFNDINEVPEALILPAQKGISVRCESCHLDRALDVEIGVEYWKIIVVVFFNVVVKCISEHLQDLEKVGGKAF